MGPSFINADGTFGGIASTKNKGSAGFVVSPSGTCTTYTSVTHVTGVGPDGSIVGWKETEGQLYDSYVYSNGTYYQINVPGATAGTTVIMGISPKGTIVGTYSSAPNTSAGFVGVCHAAQRPCTQ
jgi:hypothetical protein